MLKATLMDMFSFLPIYLFGTAIQKINFFLKGKSKVGTQNFLIGRSVFEKDA